MYVALLLTLLFSFLECALLSNVPPFLYGNFALFLSLSLSFSFLSEPSSHQFLNVFSKLCSLSLISCFHLLVHFTCCTKPSLSVQLSACAKLSSLNCVYGVVDCSTCTYILSRLLSDDYFPLWLVSVYPKLFLSLKIKSLVSF